jgi:hypothetical protein
MDGQEKILSVFAFIVVDDDGTEGVPAIVAGDLAFPMMGADLAMVGDLRPKAKMLARQSGKDVTLAHFSVRTEQEIYRPDGTVTKL